LLAHASIPPRVVRLQREAAFLLAGTIAAYYALRGGGFDPVVRQGAAFLLLWVLAVGFATGLLPRARPSRGWWLPIGALAALSLLTLLSLSWTGSDERTFSELARVTQYLGLVALIFSVLTRNTWTAAAGGVSAAALGICGLALASRLFPDAFPTSEVTDTFFVGEITDRLSYPLQYWNALAAWSAMAIAMALAWSSHAERTVTRALSLAAVPVAAGTLYLTYSRAGVGSAAVALVAVIAFAHNRWLTAAHAAVAGAASWLVIDTIRSNPGIARASTGEGAGDVIVALMVAAVVCAGFAALTRYIEGDSWRMPREAGRAAAAIGVLVAILAVASAGRGPISDAWDEFQTKDETTTVNDPATRLTSFGGNRKDLYESALDAYRSDSLQGIGPGTFQFWWDKQARDPQYVQDAHSLYLEQLAELGWPGLLLTLLALGGLLGMAVRARTRVTTLRRAGASAAMTAAFCVFVAHSAVDWMWEYTAVAMVGLGAGAIAAMGVAHSFHDRRERIGMRAAVAVAAILAAGIQLSGYMSTHWVRSSADELRAGDTAAALDDADDAVKIEPWAASPYVQRALVREAEGDLDAAIAQAQEAIDREPDFWRHHLLLARLEAKAGDRRAMRAELREARRLRPLSTTVEQEAPEIRRLLRRSKR
jgi:tetratricopeptide (TPR) repeat protein